MGKEKRVPRDVRRAIYAIAISWFFWGPADAYYALFLKSFDINYAQAGWLLSLPSFIPLFIALPFGLIADKISARKLVVTALIGYLSVPILFFFAGLNRSFLVLIVGIILLGVFKIIRDVGLDTYIKEKTPHQLSGKVWSFYEGITSGCWGLGLAAGAALILYFEIYELFILAAFGILLKIFIFHRLSEAKKNHHKKHPRIHRLSTLQRVKRGFKHLTKLHHRVFYMLIVSFLCAATLGNIDAFIVLFIDTLDFAIAVTGLLLGFIYTSAFLAVPLHKLIERIGKFSAMALGSFVIMFCFLTVFFYHSGAWYILFIAFFMQNVGFRLIRPVRNGIIAGFTPQSMQGEMTGIQKTVITLGVITGTVIYGYVSDFLGIEYTFLCTALIFALMGVCFIFLHQKYEHTVEHIKIHPHSSYLSMLHFNHLPHVIPTNVNRQLKRK